MNPDPPLTAAASGSRCAAAMGDSLPVGSATAANCRFSVDDDIVGLVPVLRKRSGEEAGANAGCVSGCGDCGAAFSGLRRAATALIACAPGYRVETAKPLAMMQWTAPQMRVSQRS